MGRPSHVGGHDAGPRARVCVCVAGRDSVNLVDLDSVRHSMCGEKSDGGGFRLFFIRSPLAPLNMPLVDPIPDHRDGVQYEAR